MFHVKHGKPLGGPPWAAADETAPRIVSLMRGAVRNGCPAGPRRTRACSGGQSPLLDESTQGSLLVVDRLHLLRLSEQIGDDVGCLGLRPERLGHGLRELRGLGGLHDQGGETRFHGAQSHRDAVGRMRVDEPA